MGLLNLLLFRNLFLQQTPTMTPEDENTPEPTNADPADEQPPTEELPPATPATAATQPPLTSEQILTSLEEQLAALDLPTMDSEDAKSWLKGFRVPLASMTTNAIVGLVQSRVTNTSDAALEAAFAKLTAAELNQVLAANVADLERITSERVREAVMMRTAKDTLSNVAASILMGSLLKVMGVPAVNTAIAATNPS